MAAVGVERRGAKPAKTQPSQFFWVGPFSRQSRGTNKQWRQIQGVKPVREHLTASVTILYEFVVFIRGRGNELMNGRPNVPTLAD